MKRIFLIQSYAYILNRLLLLNDYNKTIFKRSSNELEKIIIHTREIDPRRVHDACINVEKKLFYKNH